MLVDLIIKDLEKSPDFLRTLSTVSDSLDPTKSLEHLMATFVSSTSLPR